MKCGNTSRKLASFNSTSHSCLNCYLTKYSCSLDYKRKQKMCRNSVPTSSHPATHLVFITIQSSGTRKYDPERLIVLNPIAFCCFFSPVCNLPTQGQQGNVKGPIHVENKYVIIGFSMSRSCKSNQKCFLVAVYFPKINVG